MAGDQTNIVKTGKVVEHLVRREPHGFGYEIMKKTTDRDEHKVYREILYHSSSKEQCEGIKKMLDNGNYAILNLEPIGDWKPRILVFEEKHGDRFFLVYTLEDFKKVCLKIFKERDSYGNYYIFTVENRLKAPVAPTFTEESIASMDPSLQKVATEAWKKYKREVIEHKDNVRDAETYAKAKAGDVNAAIRIIDIMKESEYDSFRFETPDDF